MTNSAGETENQSLRGFLSMVERDYPEELLRIREPVRTHLDITSLVFELERAGRSPVGKSPAEAGFVGIDGTRLLKTCADAPSRVRRARRQTASACPARALDRSERLRR